MDPSAFRYYYDARIYNVVDGDTVDAELDLGFRLSWRQRFRLYGIDTPELNSADAALRATAMAAKVHVETVMGLPTVFRTHMDKADKYGRWLATLHYQSDDGVWHNLNDELVVSGLAVPYP